MAAAGFQPFARQQLLDEHGSPSLSSKVRRLTFTMIGHTERVAMLQAQIDFVVDLEQRADAFLESRPVA